MLTLIYQGCFATSSITSFTKMLIRQNITQKYIHLPYSCFFILRDDEIYLLVHGREIQLIAIVILLSTYKRIQALKHRTTEVSTFCKLKNSIKYLKEKNSLSFILIVTNTCHL